MPHLHDTKEVNLEVHHTKWNPIPCQKLCRHLSHLSPCKPAAAITLVSNIPVSSPPSSSDLAPNVSTRFPPPAQHTSLSLHYELPWYTVQQLLFPVPRNSFNMHRIGMYLSGLFLNSIFCSLIPYNFNSFSL